jgi:predicted lipoprotein with Yx(FWY)xxD motif
VRIRFFGALAVAVLIAACGGGTTSSTRPSTAASTPAAATPARSSAPASAPASSAAGGVTLEIATTDLGDVVVDGEGRTLYGFTPDEGQAAPTCNDSCAETWPPVTGEATAGAGIDDSKISTTTRADGSTQVKYGEFPLYWFSGDSAAGDTNGQGIGEKWFVVDADGELIMATPGAS